jgi:hypothetical protein
VVFRNSSAYARNGMASHVSCVAEVARMMAARVL